MSGAHRLRSYAHLDSRIHRAPAAVKLVVTLTLVSLVTVAPASASRGLFLLLVALFAVARSAGIPFTALLARLALAQPFVLGIAMLALFQRKGISVFAVLALKSTTCVAAVQIFAHTTQVHDLLATLRRARVPAALLSTLAILDRYLFAVVDESRRMKQARLARTWTTSQRARWGTLATVIGALFVRSVARAERISAAMRARELS